MLRLRGWPLAFLFYLASTQAIAATPEARELIRAALDHYRDQTSYSIARMTIHRPDWERSMRMQVWTQGLDHSLVRVTDPKKDRGNGTLLIKNQMWSYAPKINRIIKIPSSMANQSWMGSDFSNNDIARADDLIDQYEHRILETLTQDGHRVYVIESIPHEAAPVVWGREVLRIRADHIMLEHQFFDQDGQLVKTLTTREIRKMSGKEIATIERMQRSDRPDEWTEFQMEEVEFGVELPAHTFTRANLRNPRP